MTRFHQSMREGPTGLAADLTLRFGSERVRGRIHWPAVGSESPLIFVIGAESHRDAFGASLSSVAGAVVLWFAVPHDVRMAAAAFGWAADHADELGSMPRRLILAGVELSGGDAVCLAVAARDNGWPDVRRQLLIHPMFDKAWAIPGNSTGLAPATVVTTTPPEATASRYIASLRAAGVDIDELHVSHRGLPRETELDAVVRSLRLNTHH